MASDPQEIKEVKDFFDRSGVDKDTQRIAIAAIWSQDEIPDIQDDDQLKKYQQICMDMEKSAPPAETTERAKWYHASEGIMFTAYRVKIYEWIDRKTDDE